MRAHSSSAQVYLSHSYSEISFFGWFFLSVWLRPLLAAGLQRSSVWGQIAQFPRGNQISLSSNSFSSLMLDAATKVFLLFTTTSSTIPCRIGTLYSSCEWEANILVIKQLLGNVFYIVWLLSDISVKRTLFFCFLPTWEDVKYAESYCSESAGFSTQRSHQTHSEQSTNAGRTYIKSEHYTKL